MINKLKATINKKNNQGFTLIELLVVITLIAILAVAVLATIDPIEQRNRAVDTSLKTSLAEYIAAQERYYAVYGCYTWNDTTTPGTCTGTDTTLAATAPADVDNSINLVDAGEIKQTLLERLGTVPYNTASIIQNATGIHAYFTPRSKVFDQADNCADDCSGCTGTTDTDRYCVPDSLD